tara:strand:- start:144 stop:797 length:654 start_codon:yes stop_codon:yes gene_type:complete
VNKEEKIKIVSSIASSLAASKNIYLTDISGLDAEQTGILRRMCFEKNVSLSVVKNTLLKKAMDACDKDFTDFDKILKGNTALMISNVANAPAKVIKKFIEKTKLDKPNFKAGHVEESVYFGSDQLEILASLKSKEELLSDLIALLKSPMTNLLSSLSSSSNKLSGILKTLENNPVVVKSNEKENDNQAVKKDNISEDNNDDKVNKADQNPKLDKGNE